MQTLYQLSYSPVAKRSPEAAYRPAFRPLSSPPRRCRSGRGIWMFRRFWPSMAAQQEPGGMNINEVRVHPSAAGLRRDDQLAWQLAGVAADKTPVGKDVAAMIVNRVIDNAAVAIAAINRRPVVSARGMALGHARPGGATVFGAPSRVTVSPEWAAWANGTAVRELDYHDTFLAADYAHPGDTIPPLLAVAQAMQRSGKDLVRGIATGLRDPDRPGARHLPARAQDRPHRPSLPGASRRHRHAARAPAGRDLSGGAAGGACELHHPPVPQGRDLLMEGLRPGPRRQAGGGGGGPRHARRGRAQPGL